MPSRRLARILDNQGWIIAINSAIQSKLRPTTRHHPISAMQPHVIKGVPLAVPPPYSAFENSAKNFSGVG